MSLWKGPGVILCVHSVSCCGIEGGWYTNNTFFLLSTRLLSTQPLLFVLRISATIRLELWKVSRMAGNRQGIMLGNGRSITRKDPAPRRKSELAPCRRKPSTAPCTPLRPYRRRRRCSSRRRDRSCRPRCRSLGA